MALIHCTSHSLQKCAQVSPFLWRTSELLIIIFLLSSHNCIISEAPRFAIEHLHLARSLVIYGCFKEDHPDLPEDAKWLDVAPHLEHLEVSRGNTYCGPDLEDYSLTDFCFHTRFPKLRSLESVWCPVS